ncbi:MAG: DUF2156 domain-containing protein, partial [Treponema sp.]|nr:DUF2156 domain-containing protein [Treponema sp.]
MSVPCYPDFAPLDMDLKDSLHPRLSLTPDGVSEFTFSGLYLFRNRYQYRVSRESDGSFIISGVQPADHGHGPEGRFFMTPCGVPNWDVLEDLFKTHDYWKNISDTVLASRREELAERGVGIAEDRDNFDYLYLREELAELKGKRFHKKKNLVNQFLNAYAVYEGKQLTTELVPQALEVLDRWRQDKGEDGD